MRRALFAGLLLAAGCAQHPVVLTDRQPAQDADLDFVVMVRIAPGERPRQHEVFVGIGRHGDNPAQRYLHAEYTYFVEGQLGWRVRWRSEDRVELELRVNEEPLTVMTYVRDRESGRFGEIAPQGGGWKQEAV